jgi:predicted alpha/beta superfamily hydrolase
MATVLVDHPAQTGRITLRGDAPLSWDADLACARRDGDRHVFEVPDSPDAPVVDFKPLLDGKDFARGINYSVSTGTTLLVEPHFATDKGALEEPIAVEGVTIRVWLPPSYGERTAQRYPVLYTLDGHAAISAGPDSWHLDETIESMIDLRTIVEPIVVAIHTDEDRLARLSPVADPEHGGGGAPKFLELVAETLVPRIDAAYRTHAAREGRIVLGSSMGGLFAFFAAWTRSPMFGKAACLSPSFWWANRAMVRLAEKPQCPLPRPILYFDSGAARSPLEKDVSARDGWSDTSALRDALVGHCYEPGDDLHVLAFPGATHDGASWAARLAIPLQLLLPRAD